MKAVWISIVLASVPARLNGAEAPGAALDVAPAVRLTPAYVSGLVEGMRTNHPSLRALEARARAATQETNAVRTWENPVAKVGGFVASERGPLLREEGDLLYGVDQKLPLFGKAQVARRVAQAEAETARARERCNSRFCVAILPRHFSSRPIKRSRWRSAGRMSPGSIP